MFHGRFQCLNAYRKASCCDCDCICPQTVRFGTVPGTMAIGDIVTQIDGGNPNGAAGIITAINNLATMITVNLIDCTNPFNINGSPGTGTSTWVGTQFGPLDETCNNFFGWIRRQL